MTMDAITRARQTFEGRTVSCLPKGIDFARLAIAKALHPGVGDAERYAEARWGVKSRAARITKANVPGITTGTGAGDQMVDLRGAAAEFFDQVRSRAIIGRLPVRRIPFLTRQLSMDEGPRVGWRGEGAAYGSTPIKVTQQTGLPALDVGGLVVFTKEMAEDQSIDTELIIRDQLVKAVTVALDVAFIDPANTGSAGVKPASITSGAAAADSPAEALFDWGDTFTGDPNNAWIVVNPFQAARLNSAARPNIGANGGTWAGFPVLTSTAVPEGIFVFLDPDQVAVALGNPNVRASQEAAVEMVDSSSMTSGSSVSATTMTSLFQTDSVGVIGSMTANWRVIRPEAVQVFDAQAYGLSGGL
jgi:hypothetical protein